MALYSKLLLAWTLLLLIPSPALPLPAPHNHQQGSNMVVDCCCWLLSVVVGCCWLLMVVVDCPALLVSHIHNHLPSLLPTSGPALEDSSLLVGKAEQDLLFRSSMEDNPPKVGLYFIQNLFFSSHISNWRISLK